MSACAPKQTPKIGKFSKFSINLINNWLSNGCPGPGEIITAVIPFRLHISVSSGYLTIVSHCFSTISTRL